MSEDRVQNATKADISFYRGFVEYRKGFRKAIGIHLFEILILAVIIPIDSTLLTAGEKMTAALAIAAADAVLSLLLVCCQYTSLFSREPMTGYCLVARHASHSTEEPVTDTSSIESCTSRTVLHAASGVGVEGVAEQVISIYGTIACGEIEQVNEYRLPQLGWFSKLYNFFALGTMIIVIILLATSADPNPAEIAVLVVFLVLEAYLKLKIVVILALVALSPLICLLLICYFCCKRQEGAMRLDLVAREVETEDILKSGGECAICLMNFKPKEPIYELKCSDKHIFHEGCLQNWARVKPTCPTCRAALPLAEAALPPEGP